MDQNPEMRFCHHEARLSDDEVYLTTKNYIPPTHVSCNTMNQGAKTAHNTHHTEVDNDNPVKKEESFHQKITLDDAREGLRKAIKYIEANPVVGLKYVDTLCEILAHLVASSERKVPISEPQNVKNRNVAANSYYHSACELVMETIPNVSSDTMNTVYEAGEGADKNGGMDLPVKRKRGRPKGSTKAKKKHNTFLDSHKINNDEVNLTHSDQSDLDLTLELLEKDTARDTKKRHSVGSNRIRGGKKALKKMESEECKMCGECGKSFRHRTSLLRHMYTHTNRKPHNCTTCEKSFSQSCHLKRHLTSVHSGQRDYLCTTCGQSFSRSSHLERHNQTVHIRKRPFKCDTCDKDFSQNYQLREHTISHSGERPFSCNICDKKYRSSAALRYHKIMHSVGTRSHVCPTCGKSYAQVANLKVHIRREHTLEQPYKCPSCDKSFTRANNRKIHMNTHSGLKPYQCSICNTGFANPGSLVQHKRTHFDLKYFACDLCNRQFKQSGHYHKHKRTHVESTLECDVIIDK